MCLLWAFGVKILGVLVSISTHTTLLSDFLALLPAYDLSCGPVGAESSSALAPNCLPILRNGIGRDGMGASGQAKPPLASPV